MHSVAKMIKLTI